MLAEKVEVAVVFADVSGSSSLYKHVGDDEAQRIISRCLAMMTDSIRAHGGTVVKTIGDEVMAYFSSCDEACLAAGDIQRLAGFEGHSLSVRIGASYGQAILENSDLYGRIVNDAAALADIARAFQTIVSAEFQDKLSSIVGVSVAPFDRVVLKGGESDCVIYRVTYSSEGFSEFATENPSTLFGISEFDRGALHLEHGRENLDVHAQSKPFIIGRDSEKCDLKIRSSLASRDHCHISFSHGKYVLKDHSTNGTFVQLGDGKAVYLRREEYPLQGSGKISLGQKIGPETKDVIYFNCD